MEAAIARDPALRVSPAKLLREPLSWVAFAAFFGAVVGLLGTFREAALEVSYNLTLSAMFFAAVAQYSGQTLAALSLIAVPARSPLHNGGPPGLHFGGILILLLVATSAASAFFVIYVNTGARLRDTARPPPVGRERSS